MKTSKGNKGNKGNEAEIERCSPEWWLASVKKGKSRKGKRDLVNHLTGKPLTPKQAIAAFCYECSGFYSDAVPDCKNETCPLYQYMPYNPNRIKGGKGQQSNPEVGDQDEELS